MKNNEQIVQIKVGRYNIFLTVTWEGEEHERFVIIPELLSDLKTQMSEGNTYGHFIPEYYDWEVDIVWNAEFDPNTITSEEDDIILGEIIDENPKEMLQVAGVYELVKEHFNNDIISRAAENELFRLMREGKDDK